MPDTLRCDAAAAVKITDMIPALCGVNMLVERQTLCKLKSTFISVYTYTYTYTTVISVV